MRNFNLDDGLIDRKCDLFRECLPDIIKIWRLLSKSKNNISGHWKYIQENKQAEFIAALDNEDENRIISILQNLFRNPLSQGLISRSTYDGLLKLEDTERHQFVFRLAQDLERSLELSNYPDISYIDFPNIGNPYGIFFDSFLVHPDTPKFLHHAYLLRKWGFRHSSRPVFLEIGGGFGGTLCYLLKTVRNSYCYINCDLPVMLVIFYSFIYEFCKKAGINLRVGITTDQEISLEICQEYDIVLTPPSNKTNIVCCIDMVYNSNSLSEMSQSEIDAYFEIINKSGCFFHQNSNLLFSKDNIDLYDSPEIPADTFPISSDFFQVYKSVVAWYSTNGKYREYLYVKRDLLGSWAAK